MCLAAGSSGPILTTLGHFSWFQASFWGSVVVDGLFLAAAHDYDAVKSGTRIWSISQSRRASRAASSSGENDDLLLVVQGFLSSTCPVPPAARDKLRAHGSLLPTFSSLHVLDWAMGMRHLPKPLVALSIAAGLDRVSFVRSVGTHGGRSAMPQ